MSIAEEVIQKLATLTEDEQRKVLKEIELIERTRGLDLRAWALEQSSEAEATAGCKEILEGGGRTLDQFLPAIEKRVAERESNRKPS